MVNYFQCLLPKYAALAGFNICKSYETRLAKLSVFTGLKFAPHNVRDFIDLLHGKE
ncbi:hypothetical protein THOD04_50315 [Vibrio owensii]|nr:hypothetical protein THOD04_50315 [Vibrio owensii]